MMFIIDFDKLEKVKKDYGLKFGEATNSYYREDNFLNMIYIYKSGRITSSGDIATAIIIELAKRNILKNNEIKE